MTEQMPTCECRRFICEPIQEYVDGEKSGNPTLRLRSHKNENGLIDHTQIIESNIVDCEIKEAGQFAAVNRHLGQLSIKKITEEFMYMKGWSDED